MKAMLLVILGATAVAAVPVRVGDKQNLSTVHVPVGEQLVVTVDPTFKNDIKKREWRYLPPALEGRQLKFLDESTKDGLQVFRFSVRTQGTTLLKIPYVLVSKPEDGVFKFYTIEVVTP